MIRLLVAVFSAPRNKEARSVIRFTRRFIRNNSYNLVTQEDMGEEVGLSAVGGGVRRGPGQRVALPLPVLQERGR